MGGGHTISNFISKGPGLFNIIGTNGKVSQLNLSVDNGGKIGGGTLAYQNNGTIENCFVHLILSESCNTYGAICLVNSGSIINCKTYIEFLDSATSSNNIYPIAKNGTFTDCSYNSNQTNGFANFEKVTRDESITPNQNMPTLDQLETPTDVKVENNVLSFNPVDNATNYEVTYFDETGSNKKTEKISSTTYTLTDDSLFPGTYTIKVRALGDNKTYANSEYAIATGTFVVEEKEGLPIEINNAQETSINGDQIFIYTSNLANAKQEDISIRIVNIETNNHNNDEFYQSLINSSAKIQEFNVYSDASQRIYGILSKGLPEDNERIITVELSAVVGKQFYKQKLIFVGKEYKPNYGKIEELSAPTNVSLVDNTLKFDEVEHAIGYHVQYRNVNGGVEAEHDIEPNGELTAKLEEGTYTLFLRALGDEIDYTSSSYVEVSEKFIVAGKELPELGAPIKIKEEGTKISGDQVFIRFEDAPDITKEDFTIKIIDCVSASGNGVADVIKKQTLKKVSYSNGELYCTMGAGIPDETDLVTTIRVSYEKDNVVYLQELVFDGLKYDSERAEDCNLGYAYPYGTQMSQNNTKIRYIGKVYVGAKAVVDLSSKYANIKFKIAAKIKGEEKWTELTTNMIMKSLNAGFGEQVTAEDGWYYCAVVINNLPTGENAFEPLSFTVTLE